MPTDDTYRPRMMDPEVWADVHDVRFDEFLNLTPEAQERLSQWLAPQLKAVRARDHKPEQRKNLTPLLGCVAANGIRVTGGNSEGRVHYSRDERRYVGSSPYKPDWLFSKQMIRTIDDLATIGMAQSVTGLSGPARLNLPQSTYRPTDLLLAGLAECGISAADVVRDDDARPVVFLRAVSGKLLPYDRSAVREESERLKSYNRFLDGFDLSLATGASPEVTPDFTKRELRRIYSWGSFEHGGRFYGGWWEGLPGDVRGHILIDGEPTVELDYGSFAPMVLYHQKGIDFQGDPYAPPKLIAAFERAGIPWKDGRVISKKLFQLMLNGKKGLTGFHTNEVVRSLPESINYKDAFSWLLEHNKEIAHRLFKQGGLELMKVDSDICAALLEEGQQEGIPVLPVHDSFIVRQRDQEWLRQRMHSLYMERLGYSPIIK